MARISFGVAGGVAGGEEKYRGHGSSASAAEG
uniref:Uncharacterized protein n=1 Tax=Oryza sativa subsp. japonica TaxID=39947 RepID=Q7G2A3_ORYSJ|nr:hypothetical protein LOC_Os10g36290 [Oryza sativa Japonica Group]